MVMHGSYESRNTKEQGTTRVMLQHETDRFLELLQFVEKTAGYGHRTRLAELTSFSAPAFSRVVGGKNGPSAKLVRATLDALGVSDAYLRAPAGTGVHEFFTSESPDNELARGLRYPPAEPGDPITEYEAEHGELTHAWFVEQAKRYLKYVNEGRDTPAEEIHNLARLYLENSRAHEAAKKLIAHNAGALDFCHALVREGRK